VVLKNYSAAVVENCKTYSREEPVNEINGIINSNKFSRSYDDLYLRVTWDIEYISSILPLSLIKDSIN